MKIYLWKGFYIFDILYNSAKKNDKIRDKDTKALINSNTKINIIHSTNAIKLGFCISKIDVGIQKIDRFYLDIFKILIANFLVQNKLKKT